MFQISNKTYDTLKVVAWVVMPLLTFVSALCIIWKVPCSEQITASFAAFDALLGTYLKTANRTYNEQQVTQVFNEDLLKDMLGFDEDLHLMGELESEEEIEETEESED